MDWIFSAEGEETDPAPPDEVGPVAPTPVTPPGEIEVPPEPPEVEPDRAALVVYKFYDEDMDGVWDPDEEEIEDWTVLL